MSVQSLIKGMLPKALVESLKKHFSYRHKISNTLSSSLPRVICIDIGASYYPHTAWWVFLNAPLVRWLVVEPNSNNLQYVKSWMYRSKVEVCPHGLSASGGLQTLFVTNIDSGSSLLEPLMSGSSAHRIPKLDYFFPLKKIDIETKTLTEVVGSQEDYVPIVIKLDTQGTELDILLEAESLFKVRQIVGIEIEATLQAQPMMNGAKKFWQVCEELERRGFEVLSINPIPFTSKFNAKSGNSKRVLNECDAIFALRRDVALSLPVDGRIALVSFYITNNFIEEALSFLECDEELGSGLKSLGVDLMGLKKLLLTKLT